MMSSKLSGISTLIHIGAGQATELENWVNQGFASIVLIEPHPVLANQLRLRSRKFPQVKVVESAITERAELSELYDYTISGLASLRQPTGLKQIFPGLQLAQRYTVVTCRLAQIVNHYGPSPEQKAHLIIAAAGEEADLVDALLQSDQLERFLSISLKASIEPLYEGAEPASQLVKRLEDAGYELKSTKAIDSDWGEWLLQRDPLKDELQRLQQQFEQIETELAEQHSHAEYTVNALQEELTQTQLAQKSAETRQAQLEKEKTELAKQNSALQATVQAHAQDLQKAKEQLVQQGTLQEELTQAQLAQKSAETLQAQLEKEKTELAKQNSALQATVQAHAQGLQKAKEQLVQQGTLQEELTQAQLAQKSAETLQAQLEKDKAELAKQNAALQATVDAHVQAIKKANDELAQQKEQAAQQFAALQSDLTRAQADAEKKNKEVEKVQAELQSTQEELQKTKEWFASSKKQVMKLEQELKKEQEKTQQLSQENALLVKTQTTAEVGLAQLEDRMNQLFAQQTAQIQQATNALGKHVTRSFVQQRQHYQSVLGLQHYLESGEQPLAFGGWAIGADVASHLVQALEQHSYDLIIEFGSGTSTALMAKVISQQMQRHNNGYAEELQLNYQDVDTPVAKTGRQAMHQARGLENYELPRRILSFEQDKNHFQQTKQLLASQGLSGVVELVLAPLVPSRFTHDAAHTALFYDCENQLARVAQLYEGRAARILVLVDGPFSPKSDPLVRAPALAQVLQYFSSKHLDIMLDDSLRDGEQQVVQHWRELCAERGLQWQEKELEADKGALWITVTP
ncbi:hypothetical protein PAEH1_03660 [Paenalcaligenes hominis]|uniref:Methyltransferase FkbM domain-containing protein n=1 Tax=Paenalcaligenes hominis TaxID=643674 RepID=A0A1U9JYQ5_9BURK|nr:hypothetical protein [Paenalcaligenes hominis]AQS50891.1 hypothetical protein PAEH1_03660 [Paenalcaligenes hominis]